jgi:hypothetical protein
MWKRLLLAVAGLVLLSAVRAEEASDAKTLIKRAIDARGGAAVLRRYPAASWKAKGISFHPGRKVAFEGEWVVDPPERVRIRITGEERGKPFTRLLIIAGDKGWSEVNGVVAELDATTLAQERQQLYANYVCTLAPLLEGGYDLTIVDDKRIAGQVAAGIKVSHEARPDVRLYFAKQGKERDRLLQMETTVRDRETGQDTVQTVRFEGYREVQGIQQPMKITVRWDNRKQAEGQFSDFKFLETAPAKAFEKPTPAVPRPSNP